MGIGLHFAGEAIAVSPDRVAPKCLAFLKEALGNFHPRDFRIRLWDGSVWDAEPGEPARFTLVLQTPDGFRAMFRSPSEITLGEAYFHEDLDVEGDLGDAFRLADRLVRMREYFGRAFRLLRPEQRLPGPPGEAAPRGKRAAAHPGGLVRSGEHRVDITDQVITIPGEKKKKAKVEKKDYHRAAGSKGAQRGPSC